MSEISYFRTAVSSLPVIGPIVTTCYAFKHQNDLKNLHRNPIEILEVSFEARDNAKLGKFGCLATVAAIVSLVAAGIFSAWCLVLSLPFLALASIHKLNAEKVQRDLALQPLRQMGNIFGNLDLGGPGRAGFENAFGLPRAQVEEI